MFVEQLWFFGNWIVPEKHEAAFWSKWATPHVCELIWYRGSRFWA